MQRPVTGVRFGRDEALVAASTVIALGVDAFVGLGGLALPVYTGLVLIAAVRLGAVTALSVALVTAAAHVWLAGVSAGAPGLVGAVGLLLGASAVGLPIERHRRRAAELGRSVEVLRRALDAAPTPPSESQAERARTDRLPRLLYRYARLLNVIDEDALYTGLALTLEEVLPAREVAVYRLGPGGFELVAGDAIPPPPIAVVEQSDAAVFVSATDPRRVYGRVYEGRSGVPTAVLVVTEPGGERHRQAALKLLATFVDWASASVGHARALRRLDGRARAESARLADEQGRAAARTFAATGKIPIVDGAADPAQRERAPRPTRPAIAGARRDTLRGDSAPPFGVALGIESTAEDDDTERVDPSAVADALGEARRAAHSADDLPFGPPGDALGPPPPSRRDTDETPAPRIGRTVIDPPTGASARLAPALTPPDLSELVAGSPGGDHIDGEVRAAIERMARRLKSAPTDPESGDEFFPAPALGEIEGLGHDRIDDDMVAAEELPLIRSPGLGVASEVGRSPVKGPFAHLLADLSEHLGAEEEG